MGTLSSEEQFGGYLGSPSFFSLPLRDILADMTSLLKIPHKLCFQKEQCNLIASLSVRNMLQEMGTLAHSQVTRDIGQHWTALL